MTFGREQLLLCVEALLKGKGALSLLEKDLNNNGSACKLWAKEGKRIM